MDRTRQRQSHPHGLGWREVCGEGMKPILEILREENLPVWYAAFLGLASNDNCRWAGV